jgi:hypothetical protein
LPFAVTLKKSQGGGMDISTTNAIKLSEIRIHTIDEFDWLLVKAIENGSISQFDVNIENEYKSSFPDSDYALKLFTLSRFGYLIEAGEGKYRIRWLAFDKMNRRLEDIKSSPRLKLVPIW